MSIIYKNANIPCNEPINRLYVFFDFSTTVKAAPHERVIRTGQP